MQRAGLPITFVGDGPLLSEIQALGPPIECAGWLPPAEVEKMLARARALVFPSTWYETGGLVVLEALARGIPVIVSRTTAAADFVTDGENGFLIDASDGGELEGRLRALSDASLAERLGRCAYERYWADPQTLPVHVTKLLDVYRSVLSGHRRPASAA